MPKRKIKKKKNKLQAKWIVFVLVALVGALFVVNLKFPMFATILSGKNIALDEGNYVGLNGKTYAHHVIVPLNSGDKYVGGYLNTEGTTEFLTSYIDYDKAVVNQRFKIQATYRTKVFPESSEQYGSAKLLYDEKVFDTGTIKTFYKYKSTGHLYLNGKPVRYAGNDNIYIESFGTEQFNNGCTYNNDVCYGDLRPPADYNVPCVIADRNYWTYGRKTFSATKEGEQGEIGSCEPTFPRNTICYDNPIYASKKGECKAVHGAKYRDPSDWYLAIFWTTYYYEGIFADSSTTGTALIAFNVPDRDGDGLDDIYDLEPDDPNIAISSDVHKRILALQNQIDDKENKIDSLEKEKVALQNQINSLNGTINDKKDELAKILKDLEDANTELEDLKDELRIISQKLADGLLELSILNNDSITLQDTNNELTLDTIEEVDASLLLVDLMDKNSDNILSNISYLKDIMENEIDWAGQDELKQSTKDALEQVETQAKHTKNVMVSLKNSLLNSKKLLEEKAILEEESIRKSKIMQDKINELTKTVNELNQTIDKPIVPPPPPKNMNMLYLIGGLVGGLIIAIYFIQRKKK